MAEQMTCPECGETFTCDPDGDCWCKSYPVLNIPDALKSERCLCRCVLDRLSKEQAGGASG